MKWIGIVCGSIGIIVAGALMFNEHDSKVSVTPTTARSEGSVSTIEQVSQSLDNPIYLKSRIEQIPNEINGGQ
jgi:hypothetical protein